MDAAARAEALRAHAAITAGCTACPLAATRGAVVVGGGAPDAELMLVAEAPGFREEQAGWSLAGDALALVERVLAAQGIGLAEVYVTTVVKCRPPNGRDARPEEVAACEHHLFRQLELVQPSLVVTLGSFATRLLTGRPDGITRVHGRPVEVTVGARTLTVLPLYAPAAALYTPAMQQVFEKDAGTIAALLGASHADGDARAEEPARPARVLEAAMADETSSPAPGLVQLGLF